MMSRMATQIEPSLSEAYLFIFALSSGVRVTEGATSRTALLANLCLLVQTSHACSPVLSPSLSEYHTLTQVFLFADTSAGLGILTATTRSYNSSILLHRTYTIGREINLADFLKIIKLSNLKPANVSCYTFQNFL